jgi:hypothetical protein
MDVHWWLVLGHLLGRRSFSRFDKLKALSQSMGEGGSFVVVGSLYLVVGVWGQILVTIIGHWSLGIRNFAPHGADAPFSLLP